jgi:hypothetical protein
VRQHRPLSDHERAIIERLLSLDFPDVEYFRRQVPAITVTGRCPCGCGTIQFAIDPEAPGAPSERWQDTMGPLVEGDEHNWLMLFQLDGVLTELEHVSGGRDRDLSVVDAERIEPQLVLEES